MNPDVLSLIFQYKYEFEILEAILTEINEHYGEIFDFKFRLLNQVLAFFELCDREIDSSLLICLEHRCPVCHDFEIGHWHYSENGLTYGTIIEFVKHLKRTGRVCEHEKLSGITLTTTLCIIQLKHDII